MVSPEKRAAETKTLEELRESPRISFSADFLDDDSFISISPTSSLEKEAEMEIQRELAAAKNAAAEFEFLSTKNSFDGNHTMLTADELFFEGKLLPYWQINHAAEKLSRISIKSDDQHHTNKGHQLSDDDKGINWKGKNQVGIGNEHKGNNHNNNNNNGYNNNVNVNVILGREQQEPRIWFVDDDPSPRPPKCTVLWKELLRLKKQRASTLSPSSSSSSTSSSSSSLGDAAAMEEREKEGGQSSREKHIKRIKKGLERTRSASIRIRPMVNVPICTQGKTSSLPPLFPIRRAKLDR